MSKIRERYCRQCGKYFYAKDLRKRYCSDYCRHQFHGETAAERREVNKQIADHHTEVHWRNRAILARHAGQTLPLRLLEQQGFLREFLTALRKVDGQLIYVVFDHQYVLFPQEDNQVLIRIEQAPRTSGTGDGD